MNNDRDTFEELRSKIDGNDPFMRGHQILKERQIRRRIPEWTMNDKLVREVLLRSFPKLASDSKQRERAARWIGIIYLYFRVGMSRNAIADEMANPADLEAWTPEELTRNRNRTNTLINSIKRAGQGLRADGRGVLGAKPIGRPRKTVAAETEQAGPEVELNKAA